MVMVSHLTRYIYLGLFIFGIFFFGYVSPVSALTLSPARIETFGVQGEVVKKDITVFNDSKTLSQTVYLSFSNFESQGETGSPYFTVPTEGIGTWMTGPQEVTLEPGKSKTVTITIAIPKDASPGGHFGAVFFGTTPNQKDGGQVSIGAKTGTLVLLSVPGEVIEGGGIESFNTKDKQFFFTSLPVDLVYRLSNEGNDRIKPKGTITIRNIFFYPSGRLDANQTLGNVLPGSTRVFTTSWIKHPRDNNTEPIVGFLNSFIDTVSYQWNNFAVGPYVARLAIAYDSTQVQHTKTAFFFVFPWQLLIIIGCVGFIFFFIGRTLLRRYVARVIKNTHTI